MGRYSLVVQWLELHTFTAGGTGSISGQGTKIPHAMWPKKEQCRGKVWLASITLHFICKFCFTTDVSFFSCSLMSNSLRARGLQDTRLPCPSTAPRVCSISCPLSRWWYPTISSSLVPFSSCPQSFPASGSFPVSQFFVSDGQNIGASTSVSVLLMNIQGWFPLGLTGLKQLLFVNYLTLFPLSNWNISLSEKIVWECISTPGFHQPKR